MSTTYTKLRYHLVFGTKDRSPLITPSLEKDLYDYICGIVIQCRGVVLAINGMEDHVHILVGLPPTIPVSEIAKKVKGGSSWWINDKGRSEVPFKWQEGYGAFTVSESQVLTVSSYIRDQKIHHRDRSFDDEWAGLLKRHESSR